MSLIIPPLQRRVITEREECDSVWYSFFRTIATNLENALTNITTKQNANLTNGAGGWEDLRFPATAVDPPGAIGPPSYDVTTVGYSFSASAVNRLDIVAQMPHGWKRGSNIKPHIHWKPTTNVAGNVEWNLKYAWTNSLGRQPAFTSTNTLVWVRPNQIFEDGTANILHREFITGLGNIVPPSGAKESSIIKFQISRLGSNTADDYAGLALYDEFDIHYYHEKSGTDPEYPT